LRGRSHHTTLGNTPLSRRLQLQLEQTQDIVVVDPPRYLLQQYVMPHGVKVGTQVKIDNVCLAAQNRFRYALDRVMRRPLRPIPKRPRLEIRLEDRLQDKLQRTLDHPVPQLLNMPLSPCYPYHPAGELCLISQSATQLDAFARNQKARPPEKFCVEATYGFTCVAAR